MVRTRPVSWTSPPREEPDIRDSSMEETSEAAGGGVSQIDMTRKITEPKSKSLHVRKQGTRPVEKTKTHQALLLHMSVKQWRRRRRSVFPRKTSEKVSKVGETAVVSMLTFCAAALEASAVTRAEFLSAILCIEEVGGWRIERRQRRRRGWREVGKRNSRTHIKVHPTRSSSARQLATSPKFHERGFSLWLWRSLTVITIVLIVHDVEHVQK